MIGKQVNFFMQAEDEERFLDFIFQDPEVELIADKNDEPKIRVIDRLTYLQEGPLNGLGYLFWKNSIPIDPVSIFKIEYMRYSEEVMDFIPTGKIGYGLNSDAPVIEYVPCRCLDNGVITRGRIWAGMRYVKDNAWIHKEKEFESWYDRIARWLRRNFSRTSESGFFYLGPSLLLLHREGKVKYRSYEPFHPELGEVMLKG